MHVSSEKHTCSCRLDWFWFNSGPVKVIFLGVYSSESAALFLNDR
jgi:hypothetical protein